MKKYSFAATDRVLPILICNELNKLFLCEIPHHRFLSTRKAHERDGRSEYSSSRKRLSKDCTTFTQRSYTSLVCTTSTTGRKPGDCSRCVPVAVGTAGRAGNSAVAGALPDAFGKAAGQPIFPGSGYAGKTPASSHDQKPHADEPETLIKTPVRPGFKPGTQRPNMPTAVSVHSRKSDS